MPILTPEEQRKKLLERGLDPSKYEILTKPEYEARTASTGNVIGTKLAEQGGALAGGAAAATAASPLLMASGGPQALVTIPAYIGAVLLGSYLGKTGQGIAEEAILNKDYKTELDQYRAALSEQRPKLSTATELGSQLLTGKPSPAVLGKAASGLGKLALGAGKLERALNPAEIRALTATGAGGVLGGAVEGANQIVEGEFSPGRLLLQGLVGSVATEPTFLTKGIGKVTAGIGNKIVGKNIFSVPADTNLSDVAETLPPVLWVDNTGNIVDGPRIAEDTKLKAEVTEEGLAKDSTPGALKIDNGQDYGAALATFRKELGELGYKTIEAPTGEHFLAPAAVDDYEARIAQGQEPSVALREVTAAAADGTVRNPIQIALEEVRAQEQGPKNNLFADEFTELRTRQGEEVSEAYRLGFDERGRALSQRRLAEADAPIAGAREFLENRAAPKVQQITGRNLELMRRILAKNPGITLEDAAIGLKEPGYLDAIGAERGQGAEAGAPLDDYTRRFAASRGLGIAQAAEPLTLAGSEEALAGKTFSSETPAAQAGIVAVDPNLARPDTAAHELLHTTVRALGALGQKGDKESARIYQAVVNAAGGEEAIVQAGGEKLAKILSAGDAGASALGLLGNSLRFRLGGEVTPERLSTYLANLARSTGADLGVSSQFQAPEAGASVLPRNLDPIFNASLRQAITAGGLYEKAAGVLDSPIEKLNAIGHTNPQVSAVTDKAVPIFRKLLSDERLLNGSFSTALQKVLYGDNVSDFLMSGLPFGRKLSAALGRSLNDAEEQLLSQAMIAKDKLHPLVPTGTSTELSLELPEVQAHLMDVLRQAEANPKIAERLRAIQTDVLIPLQQTAINYGVLVNDNGQWRVPRVQGDYNPNKFSNEVITILTKEPGSDRAAAIKNLLYDYWFKRDYYKAVESGLDETGLAELRTKLANDVQSDLDNMLKAFSGAIPPGSPQHFAAMQRAAGRGLPVSLIEPNLERRLGSYIRRSAKHLSYVKNIETDPEMRAILDIPDQTGEKINNAKELADGTPIDKNTNVIVHASPLSEFLAGFSDYENTLEASVRTIGRLATSSWLGALSGARDVASSVIRDLAYVPVKNIPSIYAKSMRDFGKFFAESFETGVNKSKHAQLEFGENTINSGLETINTFSDAISQLQGRDVVEKITRGWVFAKGRHLADLIGSIPEGQSPMLDRLFGILHAEDPELASARGTPAFNELAKKELAARYVEAVQGSYDIRNLPAISQRGKFSLFFTLQRWNVEMMNRFRREMLEPTWKSGRAWVRNKTPENLKKFQAELMPLVQYTAAAALGGVGVRELTEAITNRLSEQPTDKELEATGKDKFDLSEPAVLGKWINNMEMAGYGGFLSQILSTVANSALKTPGRGDFGSLPVYEFAASTSATVRDFLTSIETPEDVVEKLPELANQLAKNNLQNYRLMLRSGAAVENQNARRNQRVFSRLSGEKVPAPVRGNAFEDSEYKALDTAREPEEIKEALKAALERARGRVVGSENPRETAERELRKLKTPARSYFPAQPDKAAAFVRFLRAGGGLESQIARERERRKNMAISGR